MDSKLPEKLLKPFNPKETEERIYKLWEDSGFFAPEVHPTWVDDSSLNENFGKPFTLIMPPTNANGSLHAGHGLVMTIEDIMVRYKRMRGFKTLWLPGLDHAGFETQVVYEKKLEKEGRTRFEIEPKKLYEEILDFTLTNSKNIKSQVRKMGASCDWSREKFTLDPDIVKIVYQTFKKLSDDNLVYRGNRIVSWCSKHQTSFSDLEILDEERIDNFYYLKYGPFVIGTSRPETKFGDKYVVMNPNDERYKDYKDGQKIKLEWINGPIEATIVKDEAVDMEFGTGVMTITPWHDTADFEIAERHKLDKEQIIDENGKLLPIAGEFAGQHIKKARALIIEKLQKKGLVEKINEKYKHVVRTCYKCGTVIEPQIKNQWFVKMKPLAEKALEKINNGEIKYIPDHYKKVSIHWLSNIMDWNISRQIVWGIPIPAKICVKCGAGMVDLDNKIKKCASCGGEVAQDKDTFDTWFSSGQWPFATLGYPDGKDFKTFYPTDVMETAGEIIFFWVSRMIMLGLYVTGEIPFKNVYLHGLVLDAKGLKMSKSKGNVIDPLILTGKYGTDAFRIGMVIGNTPGTSLALAEERIRGYGKFANKIWNATRFVLDNTKDFNNSNTEIKYDEEDKKSDEELKKLVEEITKEMDEYKFYIVAEKIYHYFWHTFADIIIERSKKKILENKNADSAKALVYSQLVTLLKVLHPFMPFVTEEIWQILLPRRKVGEPTEMSALMVEKWPARNASSIADAGGPESK
ncbi:MAG: valine--tRNA ligase [Candidatus Nomurabacteria bacterium]|nr:valine--tRNA ligase [Candidatus Nomurabacteria bacterium]